MQIENLLFFTDYETQTEILEYLPISSLRCIRPLAFLGMQTKLNINHSLRIYLYCVNDRHQYVRVTQLLMNRAYKLYKKKIIRFWNRIFVKIKKIKKKKVNLQKQKSYYIFKPKCVQRIISFNETCSVNTYFCLINGKATSSGFQKFIFRFLLPVS